MKIACLMMQKNERRLLPVWVEYHGKMFGYENLYVFDNGSTDAENLEYLSKLPGLGVNLVSEFKEKIDFERKADIFKSLIDSLDDACAYDFYFPLDCDEFVAVEVDGVVSVDRECVLRELGKYVGEERVLRISSAYDNLAVKKDVYFKSVGQKKCFFAAKSFLSSDIGFHDAKTHAGFDWVKTCIAYIHMHYRTYDEYVYFARQKLEGRVVDFSIDGLRRHVESRGPGFHLVRPLLLGAYQYYRGAYLKLLDSPERHCSIDDFSFWADKIDFRNDSSLFYDLDQSIRGCVDSVVGGVRSIELNGWAYSQDGGGELSFRLGIGSALIEASEANFMERKDVRRVHPDAPLVSGFQLIFDVPSYHGDGSDCYFFVSSDPRRLGRPFRLGKWASVILDSSVA